MREICYKCFRAKDNCFCKYIREIDSGVKFVFLMHTKEAKRQRTGTGRLASLSLKDSEIITGIDFSKNERVRSLLSDEKYFPVVLYPGEDAMSAKSEGLSKKIEGKTLLVFVIDATWFCAKKIIKLNPEILNLPKISFSGSYRSIFTFKKEPSEECVSTIESCYYLLNELQAENMCKKCDTEPLMSVFKAMIRFQLEMENARVAGLIPSTHAKDVHYTKKREVPSYLLESDESGNTPSGSKSPASAENIALIEKSDQL